MIHQRAYRIHVDDVAPDGRQSMHGVLVALQDIALEHADLLGFALRHLRPRGLTWVMTRYHLQVERRPRLHTEVRVRTWPAWAQGRLSGRDFQVLDDQGRCAVRASAEFAVVSLDTGRTVDIAQVLGSFPLHPERALETTFPDIPTVDPPSHERRFPTRWGDVDINQHVNNAVYVTWALEALPPEVLSSQVPVEVEIAYRRAATFGDEAIARVVATEGGWVHQVLRARDGVELTRLRTRWQDLD